jgi:hypothetical protein
MKGKDHTFFDQSLFICDANSGHFHINKTVITHKQSVQTRIFKISYNNTSKVPRNDMLEELRLGSLKGSSDEQNSRQSALYELGRWSECCLTLYN